MPMELHYLKLLIASCHQHIQLTSPYICPPGRIQNPKVEMNLVGTTVVGGQVAGSELGEVDGASSIGPCRPEQRIWLSFYRRRETLEWLGE